MILKISLGFLGILENSYQVNVRKTRTVHVNKYSHQQWSCFVASSLTLCLLLNL